MSLRNIAWACREDTIFSHVLLAHPAPSQKIGRELEAFNIGRKC
jgi:hypothetical protein